MMHDSPSRPVRRVMITAAGTVTAQSLIKALREDGRVTFVAAGDMNPLNATRPFVDEFVTLPAASAADFAQRCSDVVRRLEIDLLVPRIQRNLIEIGGITKTGWNRPETFGFQDQSELIP